MARKKRPLHESEEENEEEENEDSVKSKKSKKTYDQKFIPDYGKDFPNVCASDKGPQYAFCKVCVKSFKISHSGAGDIRKHNATDRHKDNVKTDNKNKLKQASLASLFGPQLKLEEQTTRAEATMVQCFVENNIPMAFADKMNEAIPKMFPDSEIASSKFYKFLFTWEKVNSFSYGLSQSQLSFLSDIFTQ